MSTATSSLPITRTVSVSSATELAEFLRDADASSPPVYPIGGGTSLDYGLPARRPGIGLQLGGLDQVEDYPARDLTITVGAGITMQRLSELLASEGQRLPIDVPQADRATLGGVLATNTNGPRRFGEGTVRDYVIGIQAVDGRGRLFKGGGRVVKNVAGYDFCKLLTGSLGTLGVITQVTLKLKPLPAEWAWVACQVADWDEAERLLADLTLRSQTAPTAIELLCGPAWSSSPLEGVDLPAPTAGQPWLLVGLEGTAAEVAWQVKTVQAEWQALGVAKAVAVRGSAAARCLRRLVEFPACAEAPLVLQAAVVPSGTTRLAAAAVQVDPEMSLQCHAGNGVVVMRFAEFPEKGLSRSLIAKLAPVAASYHGNIVVLSNPSGNELTRQTVWGARHVPYAVMDAVKREFDPFNRLNPDRFVYQL